MERRSPHPLSPGAAREQLGAARRAHARSVRRAMPQAGIILALSAFSGAQSVPSAHREPANVVTILALLWLVGELLRLSARNHWRPLRSLPKPRWGVTEVMLICVAVLVGAFIGPHLLASHRDSTAGSWALDAAVSVTVAACLFGARLSYRRRASRAWQA